VLTSIVKLLKDGRFFLKFSILKIIGQFLEMLIPLGLAMVIAPDIFGVYSLGKMVIFLFASVFIYSTLGPFVIFSNQEIIKSGKINKSFSAVLILITVSFTLFFIITAVFNNSMTSFIKISGQELWYLCLAFIGISIKYFLGNIFLAENKRARNSQLDLIFGIVSLFLVFILYVAHNINIGTLFFVYFLSSLVSLVLFLRYVNFNILFPFVFDKEYFVRIFNFTKWQIFGATALYLINWGDNFILRYFVTIDEIGVYNLGYQIFKGISGIILIIHSYYLPVVSQKINDLREIRIYLFDKRPKIVMGGLIILMLLFIVSPFIFRIFYSESYQGAAVVTKILIIAAALELYNIFYVTVFAGLQKYKFIQTTTIIHVIINIFLNILLIPVFGYVGAAIASVSAYVIRNIIYETFVYFKYKDYSLFYRKNEP
jgi:O-antigen/teichoic acid export membrane protein